jgi:bifunctional DNA-binding transcriptional regulator/antitoxin component of YhaV-PrlF toxin-antitoxin module
MEITLAATLRRKNQITWPDEIVRRMGLHEGSELQIVFDEATGEVKVRHRPESYAGILRNVYRVTQEVEQYVADERAIWPDR